MTHLLPPNLLKLFNARQPVPYLKPVARDRSLPLGKELSGVAAILQDLKEQTALNDAEDEANAAQHAKNKSKDAANGQTAATATASTSTVKVEDAMQEDVKPAVNGINGDAAAKDVDMEEGEEPDAEDSKKPAAKGEADGLTYTEGEKLRQRVAERKRKREEDFKSALKECKWHLCDTCDLPSSTTLTSCAYECSRPNERRKSSRRCVQNIVHFSAQLQGD